jgi:poly(3-hydroxybutyrate) depolymerase
MTLGADHRPRRPVHGIPASVVLFAASPVMHTLVRGMRWIEPTRPAGVCLLVALAFFLAPAGARPGRAASPVRVLRFSYDSNAGLPRSAYLVLPAWYGPHRHPRIPLVVSPHGRGVSGSYNLRFWGSLPARGPFAVVSPDGQGRRLPFYSWGYPGQIDDLARMPAAVGHAYPWLEIDPARVYAVGDSMGGQEVLLLAARPDVHLAGVAALDPVTDMARRYRTWFVTPGEHALPARARLELGGTPAQRPDAYRARSPGTFVGAVARSGIPLQLWWSRRDSVVTDQAAETALFYRTLVALAPAAPVQQIVGYWEHAHEMHPGTQLPAALACFGLVGSGGVEVPAYRIESGGSVEELPPERRAPQVPFGRAFCGRAAS